ncbi:hypothetical protein BDV25DRAFT_25604 [Aspergillus avenaceus]|uniref:Uncharacterized protein n=1 Tax=Aspergillus avenaceus TaxID=36643 RepID=A0A5N6TNP6_ASPAV|nr:hypothetical protein BDV25DRAFT_25604 [Aspergillus avenaceus]
MSVGRLPSVDLTHSTQGTGQHGASSAPEPQSAPRNVTQPPVRTKRRRHLPLPDDQSAKRQLFYFVDSNSSSREKRAHVMRHHVQEKRKQLKHTYPRTDNDKTSSRPLRYLSWQQRRFSIADDENELAGPDPATEEAVCVADSLVQVQDEYPISQYNTETVSPVTLLDASIKDPFDSLPIPCSRDDYELVDFWTNRLTYWSGQNRPIKDQIFRAAMCHPLSFQATILAYCARWRAQLYNIDRSPQAERHMGDAKRGIEKAIDGAKEIDTDSLAMALTGMAINEERFGSTQHAGGYVDQAVQILRPRAGSSRVVETFMHYVRYMIMPLHPTVSEGGQQWLVTFLRGAEELMLEHSTEAYLTSVPQRRIAFQMDSPLFLLLSSGPRPSQVPHGSRMYVVRNAPTQEVTRTAALLYITGALWDYQGSPSRTGRFLDYLHALVKDHELDRYPACESFVWLLLQEGCDPDLREPERRWSTGELLKMHKHLRPDLQFHFNEILFSLLMLTPPIRGIDSFEKELYMSMPDDPNEL